MARPYRETGHARAGTTLLVVCRFLTPGWLAKHAAMLLLVSAFLALGWWQVTRAAAGNTLSFAYAVEWPVFAGFVVFVWVREIRAELRGGAERRPAASTEPSPRPAVRSPVRTRPAPPPVDDSGDPALAAYNTYLAWLAADPQRRPSEYRP